MWALEPDCRIWVLVVTPASLAPYTCCLITLCLSPSRKGMRIGQLSHHRSMVSIKWTHIKGLEQRLALRKCSEKWALTAISCRSCLSWGWLSLEWCISKMELSWLSHFKKLIFLMHTLSINLFTLWPTCLWSERKNTVCLRAFVPLMFIEWMNEWID